MPVYNEEEAIAGVIHEWQQLLDASKVPYTFCILNDGSKDNTLAILKNFEQEYPNIRIVDKPNTGHGQSCVCGYKLALEQGADWILQIDSDGQCDPKYFPQFIQEAEQYKAVYGKRTTRDDGFNRMVISRFVSLFTFVATGIWIKDANVPYRLIHRSVMEHIVDKVPKDFHLANIYVSVLTRKQEKIKWVEIHFRNRSGGVASVKTFSFMKHGLKLFRQLRDANKQSMN